MRRHELDPLSMVFGAVFAAVGLVFLLGNVDISRVPPAWSWPIPLMIVGAMIILLSIRRDRPAGSDALPSEAGRDAAAGDAVSRVDESESPTEPTPPLAPPG